MASDFRSFVFAYPRYAAVFKYLSWHTMRLAGWLGSPGLSSAVVV
jgi:hypothetical protein